MSPVFVVAGVAGKCPLPPSPPRRSPAMSCCSARALDLRVDRLAAPVVRFTLAQNFAGPRAAHSSDEKDRATSRNTIFVIPSAAEESLITFQQNERCLDFARHDKIGERCCTDDGGGTIAVPISEGIIKKYRLAAIRHEFSNTCHGLGGKRA